jgi:hypothetical protein
MGRQTTVTLDEDVAAKLEGEAERTGVSVAEAANEALRRALTTEDEKDGPFEIRGPFVRSRPGISFEKIERLLDDVEGPARK